MKAFEIPSEARHVLLIEENDRLVVLQENQTAIVLGNNVTDGSVDVSVHVPKPDENATEAPLSVIMAACVKEFLHDEELVKMVQHRIHMAAQKEMQNKA